MGYFKHVVQDIHFDNHGTILKCSFPCSLVLRDRRKSWGQLIRVSEKNYDFRESSNRIHDA